MNIFNQFESKKGKYYKVYKNSVEKLKGGRNVKDKLTPGSLLNFCSSLLFHPLQNAELQILNTISKYSRKPYHDELSRKYKLFVEYRVKKLEIK
jgi:hypothetical protein